jgi:HAT1-interacting factor 1
VQDYTSAVEIQTALLPASSRALASSHYQLATVYEFAPAGRASALKHVQAALDGFKLRAKDIVAAEAGKVESEDVGRMSAKERENEARDVAALIGDLEVKIEELNAAPPGTDFVAESIKHLLGGGIGAPSAPAVDSAPVNDLTTMVRRKKKPAPPPAPASSANGADKRPADEAAGGAPKKPRTE